MLPQPQVHMYPFVNYPTNVYLQPNFGGYPFINQPQQYFNQPQSYNIQPFSPMYPTFTASGNMMPNSINNQLNFPTSSKMNRNPRNSGPFNK